MSPIVLQFLITLKVLLSPLGILAVSCLVLLMALSLIFPGVKWVVFGLMAFASTLAIPSEMFGPTLMFPLQQMRTEGRPITLALMTVFTISLLVLPQGWRKKYFVPGFAAFLLFQLYLSLNLALRADFAHGAGGFVVNLFVFFIFAVVIPHALQSWDNVISYVRGIASFGVIFVAMNVLQFFVKPSAVVAPRFVGTTSNAQSVGQICAMSLPVIAYLLVRPGKKNIERLLLGATAALLVIMLAWSGSRTGLIMGIVGLGLLFRNRLSRLAGVAAVVGLFALLAANFLFPEKQIVSAHLFSTVNSRAEVWSSLIHDFVRHPVAGIMYREENGYGESSYLSVAAQLGIFGLIIFIVPLIMVARSLVHLQRVRQRIGDPLLVDLIIASLVEFAVGGVFEAYMLGILSVTMLLAFAYMPILAYLLESAELPDEVADSDFTPEHSRPAGEPAGAW